MQTKYKAVVKSHLQLGCSQGYALEASIKYVRKIFRKTNISNPLILCAYQGVRYNIFSENFAYVLNGWPLSRHLCISHTILNFIGNERVHNVTSVKKFFVIWEKFRKY